MRIILLIFFLLTYHSAFGAKVDSLLHLLAQVDIDDRERLYEIEDELGFEYGSRTEENYKYSGLHHTNALKIANELFDTEKISKSHFGIGQSHERRNNYKEALIHYNKVIEIEKKEDIDIKRTDAYTSISTIYQALGDYQRAFENQMKALLIYETNGKQLGIAHSNYNLGTIFYYQKQYETSLKHYEIAHKIVVDLKNEKFIYSCLAALGSVHERLGNDEKSLECNLGSLKLAEEQSYKTGIAYAKGNIGMNYLKRGEFKKAEIFISESNNVKHQLGDKYGEIGNGLDLAELYNLWEKPEKAIPILSKALKLSFEVESKNRRAEIYKMLSSTFDQMNNPIQAHIFLVKHVELKDSLLNEKMVNEMGQSQKLYEVQKREYQIEILKKENELFGQNEKIQNLKMYAFSTTLMGLVLFLLWYRSRLKYQRNTNKLLKEQSSEIQTQNIALQNTQSQLLNANNLLEDNNLLLEEKNNLLNSKNEEIQNQYVELKNAQDQLLNANLKLEKNNDLLNGKNEEIRIKNIQLENSNEDLKQFAYVASHDLKEPLRMIKSYTSLLKKRYNDMYDDSGKEFMFFVTDAVDRMQTLLDDLLDFSRAGTQPTPTEYLSVKDTMYIVEANLKHRIATENGTLIVHHENFPSIKAHRTQLMQLLQNLVSNGLKFKGDRDPEVVVDCKLQNNEYVFSVIDNGIGISEENLQKVFDMFKRLHTREEYEGTGIGLATCKRIVSTWGGDIWVESEVGKGSSFFFSVPLSCAKMEVTNEPDVMLN